MKKLRKGTQLKLTNPKNAGRPAGDQAYETRRNQKADTPAFNSKINSGRQPYEGKRKIKTYLR